MAGLFPRLFLHSSRCTTGRPQVDPPTNFHPAAPPCFSVLYLYHLIRRPTHILDHTLTLFGTHILLTTYYAASFPTSLFFWLVVGSGTIGVVIWAEQVCVQREMTEGFGDWGGSEERVREEGGRETAEGERLMDADGTAGETMEMGMLGGVAGRRETTGMV